MGTADVDLKQRSEITVEESAYEHHVDSGVEVEDLSAASSSSTTSSSSSSSTASLSRSASTDSLLSTSSYSQQQQLNTRQRRHDDDDERVASDANDDGQRYAVLCYEQVKRLDGVMREVLPIHGRGNFPTLDVQLRDLVQVVRSKLERDDVMVRDIRLNGGAASYVLTDGSGGDHHAYNDLDLIFAVDLSSHRNYDKVKQAVLSSLLDFMPEKVNRKRITSCSLKEAYVNKMVKVVSDDGDRWSLISLSGGRNVELKFVDTMKRQFEFSVDSFQIVLDSLLLFDECAVVPMSDTFYPSVVGESVYGDFQQALYHLDQRLIATRNPEEIRGGGLLKYCDLLVRRYRPACVDRIKTLERYMCSRFFIDFSDINQQRTKLESYLVNHFVDDDDDRGRYDYLTTLHRVVDDSTVCLMGHERRQTLALIEELACRVYLHHQQQQQQKYIQHHHHHQSTSTGPVQLVYAPTGHHQCCSTGYFVTPYVTQPPPQQQPQQAPCTCSWLIT